MYYAVQASTVAILVLAANTAYQGFPRLAALLARDRFFPRQFTNLGDRLVLLQRDRRPGRNRRRADLDLRRRRRGAHPSLCDRRVHRLHPLPDRDGALLAAHPRSGLALASADQRCRRPRHVRRHPRRDLDEVRRRSVDGDHRDPAARARVPRHPQALPQDRTAPPSRHCGRSRGRRAPATRSSLSRTPSTSRPRARSGTHSGSRTATYARSTLRAAAPTSRSGPAGSGSQGGTRRLELLDPAEGRIDAVLEELWKLPRGERDVVTVVIPEQFRRRSLLAAATPNDVPPQAPPPVRARCGRRRRARDQRQARAPRDARRPSSSRGSWSQTSTQLRCEP